MKAENFNMPSREIRFTGLPVSNPSDRTALTVRLTYDGSSNLFDGIALDNQVIPQVLRAVNAHDELVAALEATLAGLEAWVEIADDDDKRDEDNEAIAMARAVLAKAKGGAL